MLDHERFGACRGSGVLVKEDDVWRITQYNLTVPVPNGLLEDVVRQIRQSASPPGG